MTTEHFKHQDMSETPRNEPGVLEILKKIQQQLVYLERKIDALGGNSSPRPFRRDRSFSGHRRSFDRPPQYGKPQREQDSGREHSSQPHFTDRPPREERHGFSHRKKPFFRHRKGRG